MRKVLICFILLSTPCLLSGQNFITREKIVWEKYVKSYSKEYKLIEIKKIEDDLLVYLNATGRLAYYLNNFHFIDYNFDGNIDIIYTGDAGTETKRTLIFELDDNGYYIKTFDKFGELIDLYSKDGISPYNLVLREEACCGGFAVIYEIYHQVYNSNNILQLQAAAKYSSIRGTELPTNLFDFPVLFEVNNESYYLRLEPVIENETKNEALNIYGNIIGEYTAGAKGYAIGKKQDYTDRVWWFVFMLNNTPSLKSVFDVGSNNENKYYSVGWMSSRYLKEIE